MPLLSEHSAKINITLPKGDVNAKMEVFFNPIMISNRNISILLLNEISNTNMKIADPLAGSGIRSLRFLKELKKDKINQLIINDAKEDFPKYVKDQLKINKIKKTKNIIIENQDANLFLLTQTGFDYIDIDPFGTPNPFLSSAIARISRDGILAITATDTAALTGTYPKVTERKYWATSLKNYLMHETGLRILIRKIQLQGIQFDKALIPILSYHKEHYFRIYFRAEKGKEKCDELIRNHQYFLYCQNCLNYQTSKYNKETCQCKSQYQFAGPLWIGELHNKKLITSMAKNNPYPEEQKFLSQLAEESTIDKVGFYDLHEIARKLKKEPPKTEIILKKLKAVRTHFSPTGIKTTAELKEMMKLY